MHLLTLTCTHTHYTSHMHTHTHMDMSKATGNIFQLYTNRTLLSLVLYNFSTLLSFISHTFSASFFCIKLAHHKIIFVKGDSINKNPSYFCVWYRFGVCVCVRVCVCVSGKFSRLPRTARSVPVSLQVHWVYLCDRVDMGGRSEHIGISHNSLLWKLHSDINTH